MIIFATNEKFVLVPNRLQAELHYRCLQLNCRVLARKLFALLLLRICTYLLDRVIDRTTCLLYLLREW